MRKRLTLKQRILVAGTLFGMFFGAGNLIFPVHLGQLAGRNVVAAMVGFIITAVGIPILGVAAIGNTHSDGLQALSSKVGRRYGYIFTCLLYLTIGPFFAIPRCATTSFTTGIAPMLGDAPQGAALLAFSLVFFAAVLFFSLRPAGITVWIGKIINPLFLVFLTILVVSALARPSALVSAVEPAAAYQSGALFSGFIEGYGTMDAIAGLAFGIVVIDIIRAMGVEDDIDVAKDVLASGVLTGTLMAVIYIATIVMGTQSRGLFETSENGGIALAQIAGHYLGAAGSIVLALTITFACLKTSIGLVTSCADAFARMFPKALAYKTWAILFTVFSFVVSNFGLSRIIEYSLPVLMFLYPLAITLILLALCGKLFDHDRAVYVSVTALTGAAALFDLIKTLPAALQGRMHLDGAVALAQRILPFFSLNLGWVMPAVIGLAMGLLIRAARRQ
ncbi:MAG: branched-chain amino acid transport system II carrier protein [Clostridia bacterium]|nr:branched-chain amino acid transport system II carrier protein [Clostridia bacterium]